MNLRVVAVVLVSVQFLCLFGGLRVSDVCEVCIFYDIVLVLDTFLWRLWCGIGIFKI